MSRISRHAGISADKTPFSFPRLAINGLFLGWMLTVAVIFYRKGRTLQADAWLNFFNLLPAIPRVLREGLFWNLALCAAAWLIFYSLGGVFLRRLSCGPVTRTERLLISAGLGSGLTALCLLFAGMSGLWQPGFLRAVFAAGVICSIGLILYSRRGSGSLKTGASSMDILLPDSKSLGVLPYAALILTACAVVMSVLATTGPEIFYDALLYHLALPKLYLLNGRIIPTPENLYSGIPFNLEMLYGLALSLSDERLAALFHFSFGLGTALAVWAWLRRRVSNEAGVFGALIYYLCPLTLYGSWQCGIDLGTCFYIALAFTTLSFSLEASEPAKARVWAVITGIFAGFAVGVKYTLLPLCAAFGLVHLWLRAREGKSARDTVWMAAAALAAFAPWLIKNSLFYGNPVYPFLHNIFGHAAPALWPQFLADAQSRNLVQLFTTVEGWKSFFTTPWQISAGTQRISDWLGAVFLLFLPSLFTLPWGIFKRELSIPAVSTAAAALVIAGYFSWNLTSTQVRFLVPILPLLACVFAMAATKNTAPGFLRKTAWAAAIIFSIYNFQEIFIAGETSYIGRWDILAGRQARADYLKSQHLSYGLPYYAAMEYINGKLPPDAKVLFLGESRAYYCERKFIAATVFDDNPFWVQARKSGTGAELRDWLKVEGVTHIFISVNPLYAYAGFPTIIPRDICMGKVFKEFWNRYLQVVFEKRTGQTSIEEWLLVLKVRDAPLESRDALPPDPFPGLIETFKAEGR
ncbi:MAG TPA: hypothetical protein DCL44_05890 [Elusimicrobia bacterium]|nr:hypothetical protein [Elusimicrobiota bacterium]